MSDNREKILEERRQLKAEYKQMFHCVADLLFKHDPAGINFEVNPDEYEYEASKILPRLRECQSAADVRRAIHEALVGSFDEMTAGPAERHSEAASEIWSLWQRHQQNKRGQ
jgi:hypothetical protein